MNKIVACLALTFFSFQLIGQENPIIPGDWSDPAVIRVNDNFYCLRSTFGWQPGLQILKSKDLVNWKYIAYAFTSNDFSLTSGDTKFGIWGSEFVYNPNTGQYLVYAPIHDGSVFNIYVFYANKAEGPYKTGPKISGSIDPGVFVDLDGTLYFTNQTGVIFQLSDDGMRIEKEVGQRPKINDHASGEGPEIIKNNGYYYYLCSAGGTCPYQQHKILSFRAKSLTGPWEADPANPLKYAPHTTQAELQGPGHGELFQTQNGDWYMTYHIYDLQHATLGRQTCLEPLKWNKNGWWRPVYGKIPQVNIEKTNLPKVNYELQASDEFNNPDLGLQWFFHTKPDYSGDSWSLTERSGFLRLKSDPGSSELPEKLQRFILQRITRKSFTITTKIDFQPKYEDARAGLILYSNPKNYIMFGPTLKNNEVVIEIKTSFGLFDYSRRWSDKSRRSPKEKTIGSTRIGEPDVLFLKIMVVDPETAYFYYSFDEENWYEIKGKMPLYFGNGGSPDLGWECASWTGSTMGIFLLDESNTTHQADFDFFRVTQNH